MNLADTRKLVNSVIENEFRHISEYKERDDFDADVEISSAREKMDRLFKKIIELLPENWMLINDFESEMVDYCTAACRYYFKEGVISGTTNLKFLEEIHVMGRV